MANINKRNNQLNDAKMSHIASENIRRAASGAPDESMNDPFSRRPTRMATYYTIKRDGKDAAAAAPELADQNNTGLLNANTDNAKTPAGIKTSVGPYTAVHSC
jgi:RNA polymerase-associated protein RTF1